MRSNLAYDYRKYQAQEEEFEEYKEEEKQQKPEKQRRIINSYVFVGVLAAVFFIPGVLYVNCIYSKMMCSMKIEKLEKRKVELNAEINKLKSDYDSKIDLKKVEEIAITKLGFVQAKEIKYIKISKE